MARVASLSGYAGPMAKGGGSARRPGRPRRPDALRTQKPKRIARPKATPAIEEPVAPILLGPLRLGVFPGASPGIWVDRWRERLPEVPIELVPTEAADQERALRAGEVEAALVRLPVDRDGLHVIPLYEETTVVAFGADSSLAAAEELTFDDLSGEILFVPGDDVLGPLQIPGIVPAQGGRLETTADAVETVAAGVGIVILPLSLVRLHRRRDVEHRPLVGAPTSAVALAWLADSTSPEIEALVGIVRGRTARSSRG